MDRKRSTYLLDWDHAKQAPWGILILFGGGFAIAAGFIESGLTEVVFITAFIYLWVVPAWGISPTGLPAWMEQN